mgnify:CR=1 FL=1
MAGAYIEVSDSTFPKDVLQNEQPVIVDFWAPWCGPCRAMAPAFEALAQEYTGKMTFAKLNTDDNPQTPGGLGIMGIPTLIVFKGGKEVDRIVGLVKQDVLKRHIDGVLAATV